MSFFRFLKSKSFFTQIAIAIIIVLLLIVGLKWWLGFTTNHDQKIQVPDLNKMSLSLVETTLKELNLDFLVIDSVSYNPNYPKRSVIEQTPEPGDFVKEKRSKRHAINQLKSIGFKIGEFYYVPDIGKDVVRGLKSEGEKLKVGSKLEKNTIIDLILGDGKQQ
jgi:hypothetical protein